MEQIISEEENLINMKRCPRFENWFSKTPDFNRGDTENPLTIYREGYKL